MTNKALGDDDYIRLDAQTRHGIIKVASKNVGGGGKKGEGEEMLTVRAMGYFPKVP